MIILQLIAILFCIGVGLAFARVLSELYAIRLWIQHVNQQLKQIREPLIGYPLNPVARAHERADYQPKQQSNSTTTATTRVPSTFSYPPAIDSNPATFGNRHTPNDIAAGVQV